MLEQRGMSLRWILFRVGMCIGALLLFQRVVIVALAVKKEAGLAQEKLAEIIRIKKSNIFRLESFIKSHLTQSQDTHKLR